MATIDGPRGNDPLNAQPVRPRGQPQAPALPAAPSAPAGDRSALSRRLPRAKSPQQAIASYGGTLSAEQFNATFAKQGGGTETAGTEIAEAGHDLAKAGHSAVSQKAGAATPVASAVDVTTMGQGMQTFSHNMHLLLHNPESAVRWAQKVEAMIKAEEEGANKAVRDFAVHHLLRAKAFFARGNTAPVQVPQEPNAQLYLPGLEPTEEEAAASAAAETEAPASEAPTAEAVASKVAADGKQLKLNLEKPFGDMTKLGKLAGGAAGVVSALALPAQVTEAVDGWRSLAHGDVDEETVEEATKGSIGTVASVGGLAEGVGVGLKVAGAADHVLEPLEAVSKVAGPAGGALAIAQGGFDLYDGFKEGKMELKWEGAAEVAGGGLLVASVACPPLAIAGGAVLLGTAIVKNRANILKGGKAILKGQLKGAKDVAGGYVAAGKDAAHAARQAGHDLAHGHLLDAAADAGRGAGHAVADVAAGTLRGVEDAAKGAWKGLTDIF